MNSSCFPFSWCFPLNKFFRQKDVRSKKNALVIEQKLSHCSMPKKINYKMPNPTLTMSLDDMKSNIKKGISTLEKFLNENKNILDKQQKEYFKSVKKQLEENKTKLKKLIAERDKNRKSLDKFLKSRRRNHPKDVVNKQDDGNKKNSMLEASARDIYWKSYTCYINATACISKKYSSGESTRSFTPLSKVRFGGHSYDPYPKKEPLGSQYALEVIEEQLENGFVEQDYLGKWEVLGRKILGEGLPWSSREKVEEVQAVFFEISKSFDSNNPIIDNKFQKEILEIAITYLEDNQNEKGWLINQYNNRIRLKFLSLNGNSSEGALSAASTPPHTPDPHSTSKVDLNNVEDWVKAMEDEVLDSKILLNGCSKNIKWLQEKLYLIKKALEEIKLKEAKTESDKTDKLNVDLLKMQKEFKSVYIRILEDEFKKLKEYCESSKLSEQKETLEKTLQTPSDLSFKLFFKLETEIKEKVLEQLKNEIKQINIVSSELFPNESPLTDPQVDIRTVTLSDLHTEYLEFKKINQAMTRELAENKNRLECEANEIIERCNMLSEKIPGECKLHHICGSNLDELSAKIKVLKEKEDELKQKLELLNLIRLCNKYSEKLYGKKLYKFPSQLSLDDLPEKRKFYGNIFCKYRLHSLIKDKKVEGLNETVKTHTNGFEMALAKRLKIQFDDDFSKNWKDLIHLWENRTELLKEIKDCSPTTDEEYKEYATKLKKLCDLQEKFIEELVIDPQYRTISPYSYVTDTDSHITRCNNLLNRLRFQAFQIKNYNQEKEKKAQGLNKLSKKESPLLTCQETTTDRILGIITKDQRSGAWLSPPSHISSPRGNPVVYINGKPYRLEQTPYGRQLVPLNECRERMPSETQRACISNNEAMQRRIGRELQEERSRKYTNPLPESSDTGSASNTPLHQRPEKSFWSFETDLHLIPNYIRDLRNFLR